MKDKKTDGVMDTFFIPLTARIEATHRFPEYFYDAKALELGSLERVKSIKKSSSEYSMIASAARYHNMDHMVRDYIRKHGRSSIVMLGAGLETMNYRLGDEEACFFSIDFPAVIEKRCAILGKGVNETMVGCDITDLTWTESINTELPVLMIVSGVFQYFQPEAVFQLLRKLKRKFPGAEMIFDVTDEAGIRYAQRYMKKTGNQSAMMYFYINDPADFAKKAKVELLEVRGFYREAQRVLRGKVNLYTRIAMSIADKKGRTRILHIRF